MSQELPVTSYALLGLLTFGDELTGYELKQRADLTLRFYWTSPAMSQVYSELLRLTGAGLVEPVTATQTQDGGRRTTRYRITERGRRDLRTWIEGTPPGFPVLKHPVALRLLLGHLADPGSTIALLEGYLDELDVRRAELVEVRESLRGSDERGALFEHPALVAQWGLAHYDSERRITEDLLLKLRSS